MVAHRRNIDPRDLRLAIEQSGIDGFDGLADLDEPNPHRVEDEAVVETASLQVLGDGASRSEDVLEALLIAAAQSGIASSEHLASQRGLERVGRDDIDAGAEQCCQFPLELAKRRQSDVIVQVDQKVDVACRRVLASGHAPEDSNVASTAFRTET